MEFRALEPERHGQCCAIKTAFSEFCIEPVGVEEEAHARSRYPQRRPAPNLQQPARNGRRTLSAIRPLARLPDRAGCGDVVSLAANGEW
jgi:hypothetical protein